MSRGTGFALDAAMHESGNLFFAAAVPPDQAEEVEAELIFRGRRSLVHNNLGKKSPHRRRFEINNTGDPPDFSEFFDD